MRSASPRRVGAWKTPQFCSFAIPRSVLTFFNRPLRSPAVQQSPFLYMSSPSQQQQLLCSSHLRGSCTGQDPKSKAYTAACLNCRNIRTQTDEEERCVRLLRKQALRLTHSHAVTKIVHSSNTAEQRYNGSSRASSSCLCASSRGVCVGD